MDCVVRGKVGYMSGGIQGVLAGWAWGRTGPTCAYGHQIYLPVSHAFEALGRCLQRGLTWLLCLHVSRGLPFALGT